MFRKRVAFILATVLVVALAAFCFVACGDTNVGEKSVTLYIGDKTIEVVTEQTNLHGLLKELYAQERISAYVYSGDDSSAYASQIDELVQGANGAYISVWHNVDKFALKSVYQEAFAEYNPSRSEVSDEGRTKFITTSVSGVRLYYSAVGNSGLPVVDGAVYAIFID